MVCFLRFFLRNNSYCIKLLYALNFLCNDIKNYNFKAHLRVSKSWITKILLCELLLWIANDVDIHQSPVTQTVRLKQEPSGTPTEQPSSGPSANPTSPPSRQPTGQPTSEPSGQPSSQPTKFPTGQPSNQPSNAPSGQPTMIPIGTPTTGPSSCPTGEPSGEPSGQPTGQPTSFPSTILQREMSMKGQTIVGGIELYTFRSNFRDAYEEAIAMSVNTPKTQLTTENVMVIEVEEVQLEVARSILSNLNAITVDSTTGLSYIATVTQLVLRVTFALRFPLELTGYSDIIIAHSSITKQLLMSIKNGKFVNEMKKIVSFLEQKQSMQLYLSLNRLLMM